MMTQINKTKNLIFFLFFTLLGSSLIYFELLKLRFVFLIINNYYLIFNTKTKIFKLELCKF